MKNLDRHNILELIGKDRKKYHSAFITCYSFDFTFFQERVLPTLRMANIKNINVMVDGNYLNYLLEHPSGKEFHTSKAYTLTPIFTNGTFHPKLMLLIGVKQGLLILGSGNLTGSGICSNDEIWGAFHFSTSECRHIGLFGLAWEYIQDIAKRNVGFINQAIAWCKQYAPWINTIQSNPERLEAVSESESATLIFNRSNNNIISQLQEHVSKDHLDTITVISPFYDTQGELVTCLDRIFKPEEINVVVQPQFGSIPYKIKSPRAGINFFEWENVIKSENRLHAKIFHFKFSNNLEYLVLGSANASIAAFGTLKAEAINDEACILLKRKSHKTYLQDLGIKIPRKGKRIAELASVCESLEDVAYVSYSYRVTYAELENSILTVHFQGPTKENLSAEVYDSDGFILDRIFVGLTKGKIKVSSRKISEGIFVAIICQGGRVSNYQLIHKIEQLRNNNPDPRQEQLNACMDDLLAGRSETVTDLLSFLSFNWADEEDEPSPTAGFASIPPNRSKESNKSNNFEILDPETFNSISEESKQKQAGLLSTKNLRVVDFLSTLGKTLHDNRKEDFTESEEQRQLLGSNSGEGNEVSAKKRMRTDGDRERTSIFRFLEKLSREYEKMLAPLYESQGLKELKVLITVNSMSTMLVSLQLVILYYGKKYDKGDKEVEFILEGNIQTKNNTIWFLTDVLGKFLLLSLAGHKCYDYELIQSKQQEMRWAVFSKSLFLLFSVSWTEKTGCYRDSLLLNLLNFLDSSDLNDPTFHQTLQNQLQSVKNLANKSHIRYRENSDYFFKKLLPSYLRWKNTYDDPLDKAKLIQPVTDLIVSSSMIYRRSLGFVHLLHRRKEQGKFKLKVVAAGLEWDETTGHSVLHDLTIEKAIVFK